MSETWIIVGASSAMARAFAREGARRSHALVLCGRDQADLKRSAADCLVRGAAAAEALALDLRRPAGFARLLARAEAAPGRIGVAIFAGSMPGQAEIDADPKRIGPLVEDNMAGPAMLLQVLAPLLEARKGAVLGVGSVAGDRGRLGNYAYGAAKAGFHAYLQGLRNRLGRAGVPVVTVKPGFVDTAMTWGLPGLFLVATPEAVARDCWRAIEKRRDVIYTPWFWGWIMLVIRMIPERIFKKLSI
jgi:short-subunit dehydrogenase